VGAEQLNQIETQPVGPLRCCHVSIANSRQASLVESLRRRPAVVEGDGGWGCCRPRTSIRRQRPAALPWQPRRGLAAGMRQLNAKRRRAGLPAEGNDAGQCRLGFIGIKTETAMRDPAYRFDRGLLDNDKPGTRQRQRTQMLQMPVVGRAVFGAVLAHRRHGDPIGQGDTAEVQRFEQAGRWCHGHHYFIAEWCWRQTSAPMTIRCATLKAMPAAKAAA
jgi:hypothetical protein